MREDRTQRDLASSQGRMTVTRNRKRFIGLDFPLEPPERAQPCPNCKLGLLASKIVTKYIAVVLS